MNCASQKLYNFFISPAPYSINYLQESGWATCSAHKGTNLDFLIRIYMVGDRILNNGDSLVKSFNFNAEDLSSFGKGLATINEAINNKPFKDEQIDTVRELPEIITRLSTYYEDKIAASQKLIDEIGLKIKDENNRLQQAFATKDYDALIEYYPHIAELIDEEEKTRLPEKDHGKKAPTWKIIKKKLKDVLNSLPPLKAPARKSIMEEFKDSIDSFASHVDPVAWFGTPEKISSMKHELYFLSSGNHFNAQILLSTKEVTTELGKCLASTQPLMPCKIIPFTRKMNRDPKLK